MRSMAMSASVQAEGNVAVAASLGPLFGGLFFGGGGVGGLVFGDGGHDLIVGGKCLVGEGVGGGRARLVAARTAWT